MITEGAPCSDDCTAFMSHRHQYHPKQHGYHKNHYHHHYFYYQHDHQHQNHHQDILHTSICDTKREAKGRIKDKKMSAEGNWNVLRIKLLDTEVGLRLLL